VEYGTLNPAVLYLRSYTILNLFRFIQVIGFNIAQIVCPCIIYQSYLELWFLWLGEQMPLLYELHYCGALLHWFRTLQHSDIIVISCSILMYLVYGYTINIICQNCIILCNKTHFWLDHAHYHISYVLKLIVCWSVTLGRLNLHRISIPPYLQPILRLLNYVPGRLKVNEKVLVQIFLYEKCWMNLTMIVKQIMPCLSFIILILLPFVILTKGMITWLLAYNNVVK